MPIITRQTPVFALGRLAVMAGQARGQQLRMGRNIQLMSMRLAAEERGADVAARRVAQEQAFKFQEAAAARIAEQRPVRPDVRVRRQKLQQAVSEAEAAGVYAPAQIKQMQIFANLGDEGGVRSILGRLPRPTPVLKPTARQKELTRQSQALSDVTQQTLNPLQQELTEINQQISARYGPETQRMMEEKPEMMPEAIQKQFQKMFLRRRELSTQISQIEREAGQIQQQIGFGYTIPQQERRRLQILERKRQEKIAAVQRIEKRNQRRIEREITALRRKTDVTPYDSPAEIKKAAEAETKIKEKEEELKASYRREDVALGVAPGLRQMTSSEENITIDALLAETGGDVEAAKRLWAERSGE